MKVNNSPKKDKMSSDSVTRVAMRSFYLCIFMIGLQLTALSLSSCSKDENDTIENSSELNVVVDNNGVANGGHSFTRIDDKNFYIDDIKYTVVDGALEVTGYDETFFKGEAKIVSSLKFHETLLEVKAVGENAFGSCDVLTKVFIPQSVTSIKSSAFKNCEELTSISFRGEGLTSIGYSSFNGCVSLSSVALPNSLTDIGSNAFSGCSNIATISIPDSVSYIGDRAFSDCTGITTVYIGDCVSQIGYRAFAGCYNMKSLSIGKSLKSIGSGIFLDCYSLENIIVRNGNAIYDSRDDCNAVIETATNTLIIGCRNTKIPNTVTTIGVSAFSECIGLSFIEIPSSVTTISEYAFYGCIGLTSVNIPDNVTTIEANAFDACSGIKAAYIGNGVKFLDFSAFLGCDNIHDIYCYATTPPSHVYSTKYRNKIWTVTLHVPAESVNLYDRFPWNLFGNIVAI